MNPGRPRDGHAVTRPGHWRPTRSVGLLVALALATGLLWFGGPAGVPRAAAVVDAPAEVQTITLSRSFSPDQIVSAAGVAWLIGSMSVGSSAPTCAIESVDRVTLQTELSKVPGCGADAAVGGRDIYLTDVAYVPDSNNEQIRIERFDTRTRRAKVLSPVDLTLSGSAIAHTAMTYGDGWLWLWGYAAGTGHGVVVQISPSTGAVRRVLRGAPAIGGTQPSMVVAGGGLWLVGGPGGSAVIDRLAGSARVPSVVYKAPSTSAVQWVAATGGRVWAEVTTFRDKGTVTSFHLVSLSLANHQVLSTTAAEDLSEGEPVGAGNVLWAVGIGGTECTDPLRLWRIDANTGTSEPVLRLLSLGQPCTAETSVAVSGRTVFVVVSGDSASPSPVLFSVTN
jgi:hypothetical protein